MRVLLGLVLGLLIGAGVVAGVWAWRSSTDDEPAAEQTFDQVIAAERERLAPVLVNMTVVCRAHGGDCIGRPVRRVSPGIWRVSLDNNAESFDCIEVDLAVYVPSKGKVLPAGVTDLHRKC